MKAHRSSPRWQVFVALLLPSDAREHVMGDLAEGNYRLRHLATAIPAAWLAHLRRYFLRDWLGPVPSFAGASDNTVRCRAASLRRAARWSVSVWLCTSFSPLAVKFGARGLWSLLPGFVLALAFHFYRRRRRIEPAAIEAYRHALSNGFDIASWPFALWVLATVQLPASLSVRLGRPLVVTGAIATALLAGYRFLRLRRERESLP